MTEGYRWRLRPRLLLAGLAVFCSFFPYPAIPIGRSTGLPITYLVVLVAVTPLLPALARRLDRRSLIAGGVLLLALLSGLSMGVLPGGLEGAALKTFVILSPMALVLVVFSSIAAAYFRPLIWGVALAVLVHAAIGTVQLLAFRHGVFPLLGLYKNPSYASLRAVSSQYAEFVARPFGLFPEPSAMAACLAPFVVLLVGIALGQLGRQVGRLARRVSGVSALAGTALIVASKSGMNLAFLPALGALLVWAVIRRKVRPADRPAGGLLSSVALLLPLGLAFLSSVESRASHSGGHMVGLWSVRWQSLVHGVDLLAGDGLASLLGGVGLGAAPHLMQDRYGIPAIYSALETLTVETGLVGLCLLVLMVAVVLIHKKQSFGEPAMVLATATWLFGVAFVTSYPILLPLWVFLAVLPRFRIGESSAPRGRQPQYSLHDSSVPYRLQDDS